MPETVEEKVKSLEEQLEILAENPTPIKITGKPYNLYPLTGSKIVALGKIIVSIYKRVDEVTKKRITESPGDELENTLIGMFNAFLSDILLGFLVCTVPPGEKIDIDQLKQSKDELEYLELNFNTVHLKQVTEFIRKTFDLGEILKNVNQLGRK